MEPAPCDQTLLFLTLPEDMSVSPEVECGLYYQLQPKVEKQCFETKKR